MSRGQIYITVEAEPSDSISLFAAGSIDAGGTGTGGDSGSGSGDITMGATISWEKNGGISGEYGWVRPVGRNLVPFEMDTTLSDAEISARLTAAWSGARGGHLRKIEWCVEYH